MVMDKAVGECLSVALWARSSDELVGYLDAVQVLAQRVAALRLALVREVDARGVPALQGAPGMLAWLRGRLRVSGGEAKRMVALARALDRLPVLAQALACGAVNPDQAQIVAAVVERTPAWVRADAEASLVGYAETFAPKELGRLAERILERVAPEVAESLDEAEVAAAEQRAFDRRELHVSDVDGTSRVRVAGWLDREGAAHLRAALDPLSRPCPDRGCAGRAQPGAAPRGCSGGGVPPGECLRGVAGSWWGSAPGGGDHGPGPAASQARRRGSGRRRAARPGVGAPVGV